MAAVPITVGSFLTKAVQESVVKYSKECLRSFIHRDMNRSRYAEIDRIYAREADLTKDTVYSEAFNKAGDPTKYRNIVAPVVKPKVEAAVVYQTSVFLTGSPIFGVVMPPKLMDVAHQMEAILEENQERGGWAGEFIMAFRDGFKYNIMAVEVTWETQKTYSIVSSVTDKKGSESKEAIWEGNVIRRLDPYNLIYDLRVPLSQVPTRGEYAGYYQIMSRIELRTFLNNLPAEGLLTNNEKALKSGSPNAETGVAAGKGDVSYHYTPDINNKYYQTKGHSNASPNWLAFVNLDSEENKRKRFSDQYDVLVLYARVCPADFGVVNAPAANVPQVMKFIFVNQDVLVFAQRLTNAHSLLPIAFGQPYEDGLGPQTKSLGEDVAPMQSVTSALFNGAIAARRRAVSDRGIYNPRYIDKKDVDSDNPAAKIPLRPAAQALADVRMAYYSIPYTDNTSSLSLQEIGMVDSFANQITGQNPARAGQFVKGNKTRKEFDTVMGNANGRDQLASIHLENRFFNIVKTIIKSNTLQYQGPTTILSRVNKKYVKVTPQDLRENEFAFKMTDGLNPAEKVADSEALATGLQTIMAVPQLQQGYDMVPMFTYFMKIQGAAIAEFELSQEERMYNQAVQKWQELAMAAMKQGTVFQTPMPTPAQFGIRPQQEQAAPPASQAGSVPISATPLPQ